jgi:hypothetical protein
MPRRTSRPQLIAGDAPLPPGWMRHDGSDCSVPSDSRPGLLFRSGSQFQAGARRADSWAACGSTTARSST